MLHWWQASGITVRKSFLAHTH